MKRAYSLFRNLSVLTMVTCLHLHMAAQPATVRIFLNQVGFFPNAPKLAVVSGAETGQTFSIIRLNSHDTVFRGSLSAQRSSINSTLQTCIADFSSVQAQGHFILSLGNGIVTAPFEISGAVLDAPARASIKAFYYQRASQALPPAYAGMWARASGHPDTAVLIHPSAVSPGRPANSIISCPGGWYDAGDYNKYIVNSGITMATLLSAYEDSPEYFDTLHTNIPSVGVGVPDLINEIVYNLKWMLTMQDPGDGGVYNKCTNASFDAMIMPDKAVQPRYVVQKGTAATLDFAAVMAQSARILARFNKQLPGLGERCRTAAIMAWKWAKANPSMLYDQDKMNQSYEPKVITGGYGDRSFEDEFYWAACELSITTKENEYTAFILSHPLIDFSIPSWGGTATLGNYSLLRTGVRPGLEKYSDSLAAKLTATADAYVAGESSSAFEMVMGHRRSDFVWGSSSIAANQGILLLNAFYRKKDARYLVAALNNLDYLLGRNATGYCFLTGFGSHSTMHPHHRLSVADGIGAPVPGLLSGGPNPGQQDHVHYFFNDPETSYIDDDRAYASNEIAINWNAPMVYLINAIVRLYHR